MRRGLPAAALGGRVLEWIETVNAEATVCQLKKLTRDHPLHLFGCGSTGRSGFNVHFHRCVAPLCEHCGPICGPRGRAVRAAIADQSADSGSGSRHIASLLCVHFFIGDTLRSQQYQRCRAFPWSCLARVPHQELCASRCRTSRCTSCESRRGEQPKGEGRNRTRRGPKAVEESAHVTGPVGTVDLW